MIDFDEPVSITHMPLQQPTTKNNPRLMVMVGILGILLLVLIFLAFFRR